MTCSQPDLAFKSLDFSSFQVSPEGPLCVEVLALLSRSTYVARTAESTRTDPGAASATSGLADQVLTASTMFFFFIMGSIILVERGSLQEA